MLVPVLLFIVGLILLIKGGDWFVDGATGIAHKFHMPELLVGATVVSIGTTLPEVMVSATSAVSGHGEIAYGNAIGSVICNTALIAALTIAIRPSSIDKKTLKLPVTFFFISAVFYAVIAYTTGKFTRPVGIVLLAIFVIYMIVNVKTALKKPMPQLAAADTAPVQNTPDVQKAAVNATASSEADVKTVASDTDKSVTAPAETEVKEENSTLKDVILLIIGAILIAIGADLLVDNGTLIAKGLGVPESVIALTFVALGTSLPELVTAITSLIKGSGALSLGNIIGANVFNLVLVSGVSTVLSPFPIPQAKTIAGMNASLVLDIPVMFAVMLILTVPALIRGKLSRSQGIILLCIYAAFCAIQFFV